MATTVIQNGIAKNQNATLKRMYKKINTASSRKTYNICKTIETPKFDTMKAFKIIDTSAFVKSILEKTKLFKYECSDKNENPSKKSREVLEILNYEALLLNEAPNLWLGYNAFNAVLHNTLKKSFSQQENIDKKIFDVIYEMA